MRPAVGVALRSGLAAFVVLAACKGTSGGDAVVKPAGTATPPPPSASIAPSTPLPPLVVEVTKARCVNGEVTGGDEASATTTSSATPMPTGGLGPTEGIGLGGPTAVTAQVSGQTLRVIGVDAGAAETAICSGESEVHRCFDALKGAIDGTFGLTLLLDAEGNVHESQVIGGTLGDETMSACVRKAMSSLAFGKPSVAPASVSYAFAVKRKKLAPMIVKDLGTKVEGKLPPEVVKRILRTKIPSMIACYEAGRKADPQLSGTVVGKFVIDAKGGVGSIDASAGTLKDAAVHKCIAGVIKGLAFPEPEGGKVKVEAPFDFHHDD